jgi:hypothetical protein
MFEAAKEARMRELNGPLLDAIAERNRVEDEASMVRNMVFNDLAADSGLERADFDVIAKEIESKPGAVWLRHEKDAQGNERIIVIDVQNHRSRAATEDEARDGVFFKDFAEYQASRAV